MTLPNALPDATPAREARYRVQAPNSTARGILVVPLGPAAAASVQALEGQGWRNAKFAAGGDAWREALDAGGIDLVVMIGQTSESLALAIPVGETCLARGVKISALLLREPGADLATALRTLRPWAQTLAVIPDAEDLPGLLHALGA